LLAPSFSIGEFTKTTQRVPVKIEFAGIPDGMVLLPGMSVEVKIETQPTRRLSWLPRL
jgi:multidrug resistance efflux pump